MQYKLRTRSLVGRTNRTVYADGDAIRAGGIEWTVADASNAILVGMTAKHASIELAGSGRAVRITIDGVDVGTFDRSGEVDQPRLATFLDAVFRDLEADWRARARKVLRHGMAKLLVYCRESGVEPMQAQLCDVDGPYAEWLKGKPAGNGGAMLVYARKLVRAMQHRSGS